MALVPQIMLGALILLAFAFTAQQKLVIANHTGPAPERQIAYLMRAYHQASVSAKAANGGLTGTVANPSPAMSGAGSVAFFFTSCADAKNVVTTLSETLNGYQNQSIARELARQSAAPPELGGVAPHSVVIPGVGLSTGNAVQTGVGALALPAGCAVTAGMPAIVTQVIP